MTKTGVKIKDWVIGDSGRIARIYDITPPDAVITKAYLTVKRKLSNVDAAALLQLSITATPSADGHLVRADAGASPVTIAAGILSASAVTLGAGTIGLYFDVSEVDTAPAKPLADGYVYDIQLERSTGDTFTAETGTISFIKGVTDAQS